MRSSLPKMLHPVCGRPMVAWPILAAREAGAGRVAAIVSPGRDISAGLPEGVETVVQPEPDGTGGAIRAALALIEESETVLVLSGDVPLIGTDTIAGAARGPRRLAGRGDDADDRARGPRRLRPRRPRRLRRGRARGRGQSRRRRRRRAARDPRDQRRHLRLRRRSPGRRARRRSPTTTPRASTTCPTSSRPCARRGHSVAAHLADDLAVTMGVNNRVDLAAVEAEARRRILEAHMLAGVTVVDPASTWIDAGVEIGRRRPDRARHQPARPDRGRRRRRRRPADHADRQRRRRRVRRRPLLPGRVRGPRRLLGRPLRLPAPRRAARRRRQGGHLRRDQELAHRRGRQGPAPRLRRRRRHRPRQQPRRRHDHRQLRRIPQEPDSDRPRRAHRR